ncbi:MAG: low molecular weight protein-tyrosine-phosphatase [Pseudohongiellaceae bacterium]
MQDKPLQVLMVCLGNICRSPTAEVVLRSHIQNRNLADRILVDSAGTSSWHMGEPPDPRTMMHASARQYDLDGLLGRQVTPRDFEVFDYILAMDKENLRNMMVDCPPAHQDKIHLLLSYSDSDYLEVPDPYHSGPQGFELVLDLVEEACSNFLESIIQKHNLT